MTVPTIKVEFGVAVGSGLTLDLDVLNTGTLGDDLGFTWTDVTSYVLNEGVEINRGASHFDGPWLRYEAGVATFSFGNETGDFDPTKGLSYALTLKPGLPVRISGVVSSVPYQLFTGFVTSWRVEYPMQGATSIARVTAHDAASVLQAFVGTEQNPVGSGDPGGTRIDRILDNAGWPDDQRAVDQSTNWTMQETAMSSPAWEEMQLTADSDAAYLFLDRFGKVNFVSRGAFPRASSVTFSSSGIPISDVNTSYDDTQLYNRVQITVVNGDPMQQVDNETSQGILQIGAYTGTGVRAYERTDIILETNAQAFELASHVLTQFQGLNPLVESVAVTPKSNASDAIWSRMMQLDIMTRASTTWTTPDARSNTIDGLVRGLHITYHDRFWKWDVSMMRVPMSVGYFVLDSASNGRLDADTLAIF